jgi:cobalt transporter subunit CbtB
MAVGSVPVSRATPVVVSLPKAMVWLFATVVLAVLAYYFIGLDEGMTSVFGKSTMVHEFVHDGRHLLGFPCH